jgi:hypothetical protein
MHRRSAASQSVNHERPRADCERKKNDQEAFDRGRDRVRNTAGRYCLERKQQTFRPRLFVLPIVKRQCRRRDEKDDRDNGEDELRRNSRPHLSASGAMFPGVNQTDDRTD